jgi:hypothetical protein
VTADRKQTKPPCKTRTRAATFADGLVLVISHVQAQLDAAQKKPPRISGAAFGWMEIAEWVSRL